MPNYPFSLRIPEDLAHRIDAYAVSRGMKKASCLIELLERGLDAEGVAPALPTNGFAERLEALEVAIAVTDAKGLAERVAVLEAAMAALQSNGHVTSEPRAHDQGSVPDLGERFVLGRGCNKPEHNLPTTNMTIRYKNGGACLACKRELNRQAQERRKKSK